MTRIAAVRCALPPFRYRQAELTQKVAELSAVDGTRRMLLERLHGNAGVETRNTVLPLSEYGSVGGIGPTNDLYIERATDLGEQAIRDALKAAGVAPSAVDLLIVTSVTGVAVPSIDARLIPRLELRPDVKRVPIFGLGCVAGATGLARMHDYLRGWPGHTAVLLAVELCSLTLPVTEPTTPDLVASGLFADGAVAVVARGDQAAELADAAAEATDGSGDAGPRIVATYGEIYPDSTDVLGWRLGEDGFRIVLTAELADVVGEHIEAGVTRFLASQGLAAADIVSWLCHPGGPKVIDAVQDSLGLPPDALALTRRSLAAVGNMSSASVLHVLLQAIETDPPAPGSYGLMIGLGPGVSVELLLLQW